MQILELNLEKDARRKAIFATLVMQLEEAKRGMVGRVVGSSSIPAQAQLQNFSQVQKAIESSIASAWAREQAISIYKILGTAEAKVHSCAFDETHFHEVGLGSTVREILGMCTALEVLGKPKIIATCVQVGSGQVECSHGVLDIPAPATAAILDEYKIPKASKKLQGELCTPTSAAFIANFVHDFSL